MKPEHFKEFNTEHAQAGAPYCQRNGLAARVGIWDGRSIHCLSGFRDYGNDREMAANWNESGVHSENDHALTLVMLPLGYCEGRPVFVGEELTSASGSIQALSWWTAEEISKCKWPRKEPVMPNLGSLEKAGIEYMLTTYRGVIEAYWKALDEFYGEEKALYSPTNHSTGEPKDDLS